MVAPQVGDRSDAPTFAAAPGPSVAVVLDGRVQLLAADGTLADTGVAGSPLGRLDGQEVVLPGHRLLGLTDGVIDSVARAFVDPTGVTYETTGGAIHWTGTRGQDSARMDGTLLGAGEHAFVVAGGSTDLVVHDAAACTRSVSAATATLSSPTGCRWVASPSLSSPTAPCSSSERTAPRLSPSSAASRAHSPRTATPTHSRPVPVEAAAGMDPGLAFFDVANGHQQRIPLAGQATDLGWLDGDLYVVTQQGGERVLQECTRQGCEDRLTDPSGTLSLR